MKFQDIKEKKEDKGFYRRYSVAQILGSNMTTSLELKKNVFEASIPYPDEHLQKARTLRLYLLLLSLKILFEDLLHIQELGEGSTNSLSLHKGVSRCRV